MRFGAGSQKTSPTRRWGLEERELMDMSLPSWTRGDDDDDDDEVNLDQRDLRRRRMWRNRRQDTSAPRPDQTIQPISSPTSSGSFDDGIPSDSSPSESEGSADESKEGNFRGEEPNNKEPPFVEAPSERLPPPPQTRSSSASQSIPTSTSIPAPTIPAPEETIRVSPSSLPGAAPPITFMTTTVMSSVTTPPVTVTMVMTTIVGPGKLPTLAPPADTSFRSVPTAPLAENPGILDPTSTEGVAESTYTDEASLTTTESATLDVSSETTLFITSSSPSFTSKLRKEKDDGMWFDTASYSTRTSTATTSYSVTETGEAAPDATAEADNAKAERAHLTHRNTEKILLGVGSVGAVIVVAALCWLGWVLFKRSKGRKQRGDDDRAFRPPSVASKFLNKIPYFKSRSDSQGWSNIEAAPKGNMSEKQQYIIPPSTASRRLDSQFFAPDQPMGIYGKPETRPPMPNGVDSTSTMLTGTTNVNGTEFMIVPGMTISSVEAQPYLTMRSDAPPPSYNQGNEQRNIDNYYMKRQTGLSEMSSISSGFGDGEIIIAPRSAGLTTPLRHPPIVASPPSVSNSGSRLSVYTPENRRDTVYTEASEDLPPRFRTVNSWVRQQTGRVKRAQQDGEDAPPVPLLPPEQEFAMMMPDGEVPRRVEMPQQAVVKQ